MLITELVDNVLPDGVHDCTIDEIVDVFGRFQKSDRRIRLTDKLRQYLTAAQQSGIVRAVVIDGSYVTAVDKPGDIDVIGVLPADWTWHDDIKSLQYNVVGKQGVKRAGYPFDILLRVERTGALEEAAGFFAQVNPNKYPGK